MIKDAGFTTKQWQLGIISMEKHQFLENELDNEDGLEDVTDDIFNFWDQMCKGMNLKFYFNSACLLYDLNVKQNDINLSKSITYN